MALAKVEKSIHESQRTHGDYFQPIQLILPIVSLPVEVLWQPQEVLEWLHLLIPLLGSSPSTIISWLN
jgi:hypothetical protein